MKKLLSFLSIIMFFSFMNVNNLSAQEEQDEIIDATHLPNMFYMVTNGTTGEISAIGCWETRGDCHDAIEVTVN